MTEKNYVSVGKLSKPHGIHGALIFVLHEVASEDLPNHFFVLNKGIYEPLFITEAEFTRENSGHISFEGILNRSDAEKLAGKELFLEEADASVFFSDEDNPDNFEGYKAYNGMDEIGIVKGIEEMPMQDLFIVESGAKEFMIPAVDDFIAKIDSRKKEIYFNLPEGLLEL